jgi:hypothetical protein
LKSNVACASLYVGEAGTQLLWCYPGRVGVDDCAGIRYAVGCSLCRLLVPTGRARQQSEQ